ncbi:hypothetical protein B0H63DRAFT_511441 [Podospora didyma]|uniref:JmjC domain-containing protein n=1 Tax=Podospora didyma TaxID=330526 RepID=A0AAE0NHP5_9PEZI|nr:hypothetical protein B0H63DRAFT_511441 [Podospora didyma]
MKTRFSLSLFDVMYSASQLNQLSFPYELMLPSAADLKKPDNRFSLFVEWLRTCTDFGSCPLPKRSQLQNLIAMLLGHIETQCENPRAEERFVRFKAPLFLLYVALFYNQHVVRCYGYDGKFDQHKPNPLHIKPGARPFTDLYIAQASLSTLPDDLQKLFPTPDLIKDKLLGKGAVYGSSLWLGVEPTYTPWHRDPNHNILTQLHSKKKVRLMPPKRGQAIFERVQAELGSMGHTVGDPKIRGAEMMQGLQKRLLHDAIWGDNHPLGIGEGILSPSDSLFIPMGWWHSIKSAEDDDNSRLMDL